MDHHSFPDRFGAGGDGLYRSFDLYKTETAGGWRIRLFAQGTEVGNVDVMLQSSPKDFISLAGFNVFAIDCEEYVLHSMC
jgi:hypothetical protein